jgi:two-component system cell cycle sensor histidine kinase/response regulator CckA
LPLVKALQGKSVDNEEIFIRNEQIQGGRYISVTGRPLIDSNEELKGGVTTYRDITDKKIAESLLKKSESFNKDALNSMLSHVSILDKHGFILAVNDSWNKFALHNGINPDGVGQGINYLEICRNTEGEDKASAMKVLEGIQRVIDGKENNFIIEYPCHSPGEKQWFLMNVTSLTGNAGVLISHLNITAQKLNEEKLREQAPLLDITTDAITVSDLEEKIIYCNKGAELLYGYKKEELIGNKFYEILNKEPFSELDNAINSVMKNGSWEGELQQVTKNGELITIESKWTLMTNNKGEPVSILVVSSDITKRKIMEEEYLRGQRLESIGTLAGGIAHDLNNVLTPMMMSVELLKMRLTDQKGLNLIDSMKKSTQHGADLVKQLLIFARGGEAGEHFTLEPASILTEIKKIVGISFPKTIDFFTEIPVDLKKIRGDATQLNQVLMNLLVNARDAMPEGGIITISAKNIFLDNTFAQMNADAKTGNYVLISVSDTGSGIPKRIIAKIFEPFFTTKVLGKGTGLGLSTSIGIIKSHGGFINVSSKEGRGSEFKIYLPVTEINCEASNKEIQEQNFRGNGETILLIDDEDAIVEAISQSLELFNFRVIKASDGVEGISVYVQNNENISLVITDIMLPLMDGHQTMKAILKIKPSEKFIVISGHEQVENIQQVGNQIKVINKPFTADSLLKAIQEHLNK